MSSQRKPTIVFCHGIWADGSCFSKVIPALQADGHEVIAVQYGLESFEEDVATIKRTLNRVGSPVLLVGHSYGGATITASGVDDRVVGLVYIGAVAPDVGETVQDQLDKYPSDIFSRVEVADGCAWMLPNGTEFFCGDLSEQEQKLVWATHFPPVMPTSSSNTISRAPRGSRSQAGTFCATQDHTVHPDLQRWVSKRMGATVDRGGKQPRSHALQAGCSHRGDPQGRKSNSGKYDSLVRPRGFSSSTDRRQTVCHFYERPYEFKCSLTSISVNQANQISSVANRPMHVSRLIRLNE